ncbi:hypothetical protein [Thermodesulfovibrio sp.]|uniref:hypothetical protein n=1 Tax=Thermodesulfovibrio sp. TaxID=2067987 RepID=UPI003D0C5772
MSDKAVRSIELAKQLGVKPSEIVKFVEKIRNVQFKKRTTNINIEPEEVDLIKQGRPPRGLRPL